MVNNVLTVSQYAKLRKCSAKNVYNQIYAVRLLEGISKYEKRGNTYFLYADKPFMNQHQKALEKII